MLGLDFETYSDVDLKVHGLERYVKDPSFRVLIASVARLGHKTQRFDFISGTPALRDLARAEFAALLQGDGTIVAHNAPFEVAVLEHMGIRRIRWRDSAVIARAMGASSALQFAAPQLTQGHKLETGSALIKKFCVPRPNGTRMIDEIDSWEVKDWEDWNDFGTYCDVDAQESLHIWDLHGHNLSSDEWENARVTQMQNEHGWYVDLPLVHEMQRLYLENLHLLEEAFHHRHRGQPKRLNFRSPQQMMKWCKDRGVRVTSLDEQHLIEYLGKVTARINLYTQDPDKWANRKGQPTFEQLAEVLDMLQTKQQLGGSSLSKLQVIIDQVGPDGRLHGQYMHVGAGQTFRTSGRGVQMQNLKRLRTIDPVEQLFAADKAYDHEWDNDRLARNLRQVFTAQHPQGQLIVGDFSSVESRGLAYLAGEDWKLKAYRRGQDMYKVLAASMFNTSYEMVDKAQRSTGKVGELSCGYGAGGGAVAKFARKMGMEMDESVAAQLVADWREANPKIVQFWESLDKILHDVVERGMARASFDLPHGNLRCMIEAVAPPNSLRQQIPGCKTLMVTIHDRSTGNAVVKRFFQGAHMQGRDVCYVKPSELQGGDKLWRERWSFKGASGPYKLYGGKLAGILTQSFCRELFFEALRLAQISLETSTSKVIGQFHDEIIVEWTPSEGGGPGLNETIDRLTAVMGRSDRFPDFPLDAEVKHDHRYIK